MLAGPSERMDAGPLPLRGDLAHIRLAGQVFVPHYAAPITFEAIEATMVRAAADAGAQEVQPLAPGDRFDVLDIAGDWAWGVVAGGGNSEYGPVGYVPVACLGRGA